LRFARRNAFEQNANRICVAFVITSVILAITAVAHLVITPVVFPLRVAVGVVQLAATVAIAMLTLHFYVRKNPLGLAGGVHDGYPSLPAVKNAMGMALKEVLDTFQSACLSHFQQNKQLQEEYYISALLQKAGRMSPIGLKMTTVVTDEVIKNETPMAHFMRKAATYRAEWLRTRAPSTESKSARYMRMLVDQVEVSFAPPADVANAIAYWQNVIDNRDDYMYRDYALAVEALADLQTGLGTPEHDYYNMDLVQKLVWLQNDPRYKQQADSIMYHVGIYKEVRT